MKKTFVPYLAHSELTNEIYIIYSPTKKVCVTDQVIRAMEATGRIDKKDMNCNVCEEMGLDDCINCTYGNYCLGCDDYDEETRECKSNGGCADMRDEGK